MSNQWHELPFSHGIEVENHLVNASGEVLTGKELLDVWETMFQGAAEFLSKITRDKSVPPLIRKRIRNIEVREEEKRERRLKFVFIEYKLGKKNIKVPAVGPDPNITQITWLLELVTPPCDHIEELRWWIDVLYQAVAESLPSGISLMVIGLNPKEEEFRSGLTCGEHHHMGFPDQNTRIYAYNMIRNYIPHIIALSSSSPFIKSQPTGSVNLRETKGRTQVLSSGCVKSLRVKFNTGQLGPHSPTFLPPLSIKSRKKDFSEFVHKEPPDDRMVDLYPFTDYGTIEMRFIDAQFFTDYRFALVVLFQALSLKGTRIGQNKKDSVPTVESRVLYDNREKAFNVGLLGRFTSANPTGHEEFDNVYNFDPETGKRSTKLIQSVKGMLFFLRNELNEIDPTGTIIAPLLVTTFGNDQFHAPFSPAEALLYQYEKDRQNIQGVIATTLYQNKEQEPSRPILSWEAFNSFIPEVPVIVAPPSQKTLGLAVRLQSDAKQRTGRVEEDIVVEEEDEEEPDKIIPRIEKPPPSTRIRKKPPIDKKPPPKKKVPKKVVTPKEPPPKRPVAPRPSMPMVDLPSTHSIIQARIAQAVKTKGPKVKKTAVKVRKPLAKPAPKRVKKAEMFHPAPDRVSLHMPEMVKDPTFGYLTVQWSRNAELHSVLNRVELIIEIHQESRTKETRFEHIVTGEDHRSRTIQLLVPINPASFIIFTGYS